MEIIGKFENKARRQKKHEVNLNRVEEFFESSRYERPALHLCLAACRSGLVMALLSVRGVSNEEARNIIKMIDRAGSGAPRPAPEPKGLPTDNRMRAQFGQELADTDEKVTQRHPSDAKTPTFLARK